MYLQQEQYSVLQAIKNNCKKREGSFITTKSGKQIYKPSIEYVKMREKLQEQTHKLAIKKSEMISTLKESCNKINRIQKAMEIATSKGKKVSHINGGKIILKNKTN